MTAVQAAASLKAGSSAASTTKTTRQPTACQSVRADLCDCDFARDPQERFSRFSNFRNKEQIISSSPCAPIAIVGVWQVIGLFLTAAIEFIEEGSFVIGVIVCLFVVVLEVCDVEWEVWNSRYSRVSWRNVLCAFLSFGFSAGVGPGVWDGACRIQDAGSWIGSWLLIGIAKNAFRSAVPCYLSA